MTNQRVLLIGGVDPTLGAGILLDSLTVIEHGLIPQVVVSAVTAQNSSSYISTEKISSEVITDQINCVVEENTIEAVKIGMLASKAAVEAVATYFEDNPNDNIVLDPLLKSSTGAELISEVGYQLLKVRLLPLTSVVTPNLGEAENISEIEINRLEEAKEAARHIHLLGPKNVLITGGHFHDEEKVTDLLYDGSKFYKLSSSRLEKGNVRGTGCLLSTSVAAHLAQGKTVVEAITEAEKYCRHKIVSSKKVNVEETYKSDLSEFEV